MNTNQPTAAAIRAANEIVNVTASDRERDIVARLIDRETGLPELLEACKSACRAAADCLPISGESDVDALYYKAKLMAIDEAASQCSKAILKAEQK